MMKDYRWAIGRGGRTLLPLDGQGIVFKIKEFVGEDDYTTVSGQIVCHLAGEKEIFFCVGRNGAIETVIKEFDAFVKTLCNPSQVLNLDKLKEL